MLKLATPRSRSVPRLWIPPSLLAFGLLILLLFSPLARASGPIEAVWSFNGGRVAVQSTGQGTLTGTVVAPTKFSLCTHVVGEEMWTQMVEQPDGSYWGLHQWFYESSECFRNPGLGPTAWRVLETPQGQFLRVCLSEPGSNLQPTIAPDGTSTNATFGCVDSARSSSVPKPGATPLSRYVHFPSNRRCLGRRKLRIRLPNPENDSIEKAQVTASGGGVTRRARLRHGKNGILAIVRVAGIPGDTVTVRVRLATVLGQKLVGKRVYRRCKASG